MESVRLIDWKTPASNDFLLVSQFWVTGEMYIRRADLMGFVNGIPLVFIELKAAHARLETAYTGNLSDYKNAIPQLFWYNALIVLSNGSHSRIGSMTASWEHFAEWKKINGEGEEGVISLETMIRGTCDKARLLDDAVEALIANDDSKKRYLTLAATIWRLYKTILPDSEVKAFAARCLLFDVLAKKIRALTPPASGVCQQWCARSVYSEQNRPFASITSRKLLCVPSSSQKNIEY